MAFPALLAGLLLSGPLPDRPAPSTPDGPPVSSWYAAVTTPCGASMLLVRETPDGPETLVRPTGSARPAARLHTNVLIGARMVVTGRMTGRVYTDVECGTVPELEVLGFAPWGPVERAFSATALDGEFHIHTGDRPLDHYVSADFLDGPEPVLLDADACITRPAGGCGPGLLEQTDSAEFELCCPRAGVAGDLDNSVENLSEPPAGGGRP